LNTNALLFKYLVIGGGCAFATHLQKFINVNLGVRTNFVNLGVAHYARVSGNHFQNSTWELNAGFTIRDVEHRRAITNFEAW
jgi:hypothetical protein